VSVGYCTAEQPLWQAEPREHTDSANPPVRRTPGAAEIPGTCRIFPFAEPKIPHPGKILASNTPNFPDGQNFPRREPAEIPGTRRILPFAEPKISRRAEFPRAPPNPSGRASPPNRKKPRAKSVQ